jgi:hypothetical protein
MNTQNPYDQLGVSEDASFDDIQTARNRLLEEHQGDPKQLEQINVAYDAVLMERLKLRQEGRIKVPDRIRFPEKVAVPPPPKPSSVAMSAPGWIQSLRDTTPLPKDVWLSAGVYAALSAVVVLSPLFNLPLAAAANLLQMTLVLGMGAGFYFLYRKERKLGRAVLLGVTGLVLGYILGGALEALLRPQLALIGLSSPLPLFATAITFLVFWLISAFLR